MAINGIVSMRKIEHWASWDVVYEWEDIFSEVLGIPIVCERNSIIRKILKVLFYHFKIVNRLVSFSATKENWNLTWVMNAENLGLYTKTGNIPIFLDATASTIQNVIRATCKLPLFFVTCYEYYTLLKKAGCKNVYFMPLSISDKNICIKAKKTIDVLQFGRKNKVLHKYMLKYCKAHPKVEYVYQKNDGSLTYTSTIRGQIGKFDARQEYLDMMASAKVSLVSSPGCDGSKDFGNGIDFISPRFYESIACRCHLIGRYTSNKETEMIGLSKVCPNVKTYEEFSNMIKFFLNCSGEQTTDEKLFLENNCTSKRAKYIYQILADNQMIK